MRKRILSLLLAVCTLASLLSVPAAAADTVTFSDISDRDTVMAVESLRLMGVLDGYGDGSFRPNATLTRAQFCKMAVYAMDGSDELGRYSTITVFPDVKPSYWAAAYVNMAAKGKNIIAGYTDGKFHPNDTVTVGQAVTILLRLLGYKDENIGGIWPQSYMAQGATIGLTDGVSTNGYAGLTRGQAARLFLNLLRSDKAEGGSYAATLGTVVNDAMLVASDASAPNGQPNALQLSTGAVYPLASGKTSSGALNGHKGTLIVDKEGQALTFVPDGVGSNKTITLASASATEITDINGVKYVVPNGVSAFYNGKESSWSETYSWVNTGSSVTLYLSAAGVVEYIFVGGGSTSNAAVIVYDNGSIAGFSSLGGSGSTIYKNGLRATAADMRKYDVATFSAATNSIRVTDTRITGYYESCSPNPKEPAKITVMGHEFNVLPTAREMLAKFKPGDQMTLLLTEDNQVAGAVAASVNEARGNAAGIVTSVSASEVTVELLCGITVKGKTTLSESQAETLGGQLVRVASDQKDTVSVTRLTGGASGALNVEEKKLGTKDLADNVIIFQNSADGMTAISLSQLTTATVPASEISYARTNWAGDVDLIVLGSAVGSTLIYGRAIFEDGDRVVTGADGKEEVIHGNNKITLEVGNGKTYGPYETGYVVKNGECIGLSLTGTGSNKRIAALVRLQGIQVSNTAWAGQSAVTTGGRTYTVPANVPCYNRDTQSWVTLNEAHAYATTSTIYIHNGAVRLIEVGG